MRPFLFILFAILFVNNADAQIVKCGQSFAERQMIKKYPQFEQVIEHNFEEAKKNMHKSVSQTLTIPVVVHVIYNTQDQNISDEVIRGQIDVLNKDFNRLNDNASETRPIFEDVAGNAMIDFRLAAVDPDGNATNGITRTQTDKSTFIFSLTDFTDAVDACGVDIMDQEAVNDSLQCILDELEAGGYDMNAMKFESKGGVDPWDQEQYLNIWVCNLSLEVAAGVSIPFLLGFAYPPMEAPNWPFEELPDDLDAVDGVVLHSQVVAPNNPNPGTLAGSNDLGTTATHEVGHYLGLRHIWGDGDCTMDDGLADTPTVASEAQSTGGQNCTDFHANDTCLEDMLPDMIENYMDYSPDQCRNMFSVDQVGLMRAMLEGPRAGLLDGMVATQDANWSPINVFPNPASSMLQFETESQTIEEVEVYDLKGRQVLEAQANQQQIDVSQLELGIYFLKIPLKNGRTAVKKFVKN